MQLLAGSADDLDEHFGVFRVEEEYFEREFAQRAVDQMPLNRSEKLGIADQRFVFGEDRGEQRRRAEKIDHRVAIGEHKRRNRGNRGRFFEERSLRFGGLRRNLPRFPTTMTSSEGAIS